MKHRRGWKGAAPEFEAGCGVQRSYLHVDAAFELSFFFFFSDSHRLGSVHADSASIRAHSARIGPYRPNRIVSAGDRNDQNSRNKPKSALIHAAEDSPESGYEVKVLKV